MRGVETRHERHTPLAVIAISLAGAAALAFSVADWIWFGTSDTGGAGVSGLYILGWVLLVWAIIVGAFTAVQMIRSAVSGQRPAPTGIALVIGVALVVVFVFVTR